jgi:hypothetical protein
MNKFACISVLAFFVSFATAQELSTGLVEYFPAPGQHINIENIGTPKAAQKMTENFSSVVSLGSFGGYVVLKFNTACKNQPENPYGIDFTIFGNAFSGSSEPGVVLVMEDTNRNGLPDDTWYEIAGSSHFFSGTVKNYAVTYYKTHSRDVMWKDNRSQTGIITANEFNLQPYFPEEEHFPFYPADSVAFKGTLLENHFIKTNNGEIKLVTPVFGYADCHSIVQGVEISLPDNPYTPEKEGAGGNPIDISWAVDSLGNYVELDSVNFVKIVSASLKDAGVLGEISTDVAWVQKVKPQPDVSGKVTLLVLKHHPLKFLSGDTLQLEAVYFEQGRKSLSPVSFQSLNEAVALIDDSGKLIAKTAGVSHIRFSAANEADSTLVQVVVPDSISIRTDFSAVYPGDTLELNADIFDNEHDVLEVTAEFSALNTSAGKIIESNGKSFLIAIQPGILTLMASINGFPVTQQVQVKILSPNDIIKVLLSVKTADGNILPMQWVETGPADLNAVVENRQYDYASPEKVSLFHALASGLQKAGVPFQFRDDEAAGGNLYLYKVEKEGLFSYGWGGKTNPAAFARAWIVRLNSRQYIDGFDKIQIANGDTVVLYHVSDILNSWFYSRLLSTLIPESSDKKIEIRLEETACFLDNGNIMETGFSPLVNAAVYAGSTYYTDETGSVQLDAGAGFPLLVSSGNDALLLTAGAVTRAEALPLVFRIYPNPVKNHLTVVINSVETTRSSKGQVRLLDITGRTVLEEEFITSTLNLDLSILPAGVYHLVIKKDNFSEIQKLVKQ